jgi:DNA-binding XRE family transcriptional regulator
MWFMHHHHYKSHGMQKNSLKVFRESLMMSKAELARDAGVSHLTISRIEQEKPGRMETQRKILLALGLKVSDKKKVFRG